MNDKINGLAKKYVMWPELKNDFQKNIYFGNTHLQDFRDEIYSITYHESNIATAVAAFYLANERLSQGRIHTQDVLGINELNDYDSYKKTLGDLSKKLLTYIFVCCLVEARHDKTFNDFEFSVEEHFEDEVPEHLNIEGLDINEGIALLEKHPKGMQFINEYLSSFHDLIGNRKENKKFRNFFGQILVNINNTFNNQGRDLGYTEVADGLLPQLNDYTIEEALSYLHIIFSVDNFESGYGGSPWAQIAKHGLDFVQGKMNAEMFIDQAFSLEHNNGNMFNKNFLFSNRSSVDIHYFDEEYMEQENSVPLLPLFLNAQHLGHLKGLFNLEHTMKEFQNVLNDPVMREQFYIELSTLPQFKAYFESFNELDEEIYAVSDDDIEEDDDIEANTKDTISKKNKISPTLISHIDMAFLFIKNVVQAITPIKEELVVDYDNYFSNITHIPFNIKDLIYETATRFVPNDNEEDEDLIQLRCAARESYHEGFFSMINYLHNNRFNPTLQHNIKKDFAFDLYDIHNLPESSFDKNIIGGKAWSLVNMNKLGLPVPKAKVFTTDCCSAYHQHKEKFNEALNNTLPQFSSYLTKDVSDSKKEHDILDVSFNWDSYYQHFYDNKLPILCSVRSGAPISMPGMMDTILNVGIDDSNYEYFYNTMGSQVVHNCINKFMELFCSSRLGIKIKLSNDLYSNLFEFSMILNKAGIEYSKDSIHRFPLNKEMQIKESLIAVFDSWHSERAIAYRTEKGISHDLGTAAIVQQMVFGNLNENSCTGVVFSRDCLTGENKLVGEFLPKAQGEDVVSGSVTPFPIDKFKQFNPQAYNELLDITKKLEQQTGQIQDIEFTVEDGKLYILQHRQAICSPVAALEILKDKTIKQDTLLKQIDPKLLQTNFSISTTEPHYIHGLSANSGVIQGIVIRNEYEMTAYQEAFNLRKKDNQHFGWIFYANLTSPEHMPLMNKTQAFITEQGGFTSHAAIIARSLNKPCIVGIGQNNAMECSHFASGDIITIDGDSGKIWKGEQNIVENKKIAQAATKILINSYNVDLTNIEEKEFKEHVELINNNNRSWVFQFPNTKYIKETPIKKAKFLSIGQKVALFLAANQREEQSKSVLTSPKLD